MSLSQTYTHTCIRHLCKAATSRKTLTLSFRIWPMENRNPRPTTQTNSSVIFIHRETKLWMSRTAPLNQSQSYPTNQSHGGLSVRLQTDLRSMSAAWMVLKSSSATPAPSTLMRWGWKRASGAPNRSPPTFTWRPSGSCTPGGGRG